MPDGQAVPEPENWEFRVNADGQLQPKDGGLTPQPEPEVAAVLIPPQKLSARPDDPTEHRWVPNVGVEPVAPLGFQKDGPRANHAVARGADDGGVAEFGVVFALTGLLSITILAGVAVCVGILVSRRFKFGNLFMQQGHLLPI